MTDRGTFSAFAVRARVGVEQADASRSVMCHVAARARPGRWAAKKEPYLRARRPRDRLSAVGLLTKRKKSNHFYARAREAIKLLICRAAQQV